MWILNFEILPPMYWNPNQLPSLPLTSMYWDPNLSFGSSEVLLYSTENCGPTNISCRIEILQKKEEAFELILFSLNYLRTVDSYQHMLILSFPKMLDEQANAGGLLNRHCPTNLFGWRWTCSTSNKACFGVKVQSCVTHILQLEAKGQGLGWPSPSSNQLLQKGI